jgi:hypothetical protein
MLGYNMTVFRYAAAGRRRMMGLALQKANHEDPYMLKQIMAMLCLSYIDR